MASVDEQLPRISDEFMQERLSKTRQYTLVMLRAGPAYSASDAGIRQVVWEHGRRNFALREAGLLPIVCPVLDGSELCGIGLFDADAERVAEIMEGDPGVQAGIFTYEVHPVRGFPGSSLP